MYKLQKNRSVGEKAKEEIVRMLISGKIKPGDRLKEVEIAQQMGISRIPVRDALLMLEQEGFIQSGSYKNSVVVGINSDELKRVLLPIRSLIETYAIEKFIQIANDEQLEYLDYQIHRMSWALDHENMEQFVDADIEFHECIMDTDDMKSLMSIWSGISNRMRIYFFASTLVKKDKLLEVIEDHNELVACMKRKDIAAAVEKLQAHINEIVI